MLKGFSLRQGGFANGLMVTTIKMMADLVSWVMAMAARGRTRRGGMARK